MFLFSFLFFTFLLKTKASKYVGRAVSSVAWGVGEPYVASWTTTRGDLEVRSDVSQR